MASPSSDANISPVGPLKLPSLGPVTKEGEEEENLNDSSFPLSILLSPEAPPGFPPALHALYREGLFFIKEALEFYGLDRCALSFNGGKDCTVLLSLLDYALSLLGRDFSGFPILYFPQRLEFPEIEDFLSLSASFYHLQYFTLNGDFILGLKNLQQERKITAIFMGQRQCDPGIENLRPVEASDTNKGWPAFDRINPLIRWNYGDIWHFIRKFKIPYCELYNRGFTSIGNSENSWPNPALAIPGQAGEFQPAFKLKEFHREREGRKNK